MGSAVEPWRPAERVFSGRPGPEGETPAQAPAETRWWRRFAAALAPGTLQAGRRGYHRRRGEEQREEREWEEGTEEAGPAGRACRAEEDRERPLLPGPLRCCPGVGSTRSPARHAAPRAAGQGSGNPTDREGEVLTRSPSLPPLPGLAGSSHVRQRGRSPSGQVPTLGIGCSLRRSGSEGSHPLAPQSDPDAGGRAAGARIRARSRLPSARCRH
ncbi:opioid growth factor receptor-like [Bubalus bubalis]|uniref:opioid growth factor receptor-like n=1 Tax=Bubalus bubalis TaxID=89462 RepID=UPI00042CE0C7|nr:opioid growth factor receptor-like [Bubalus bubalis]